MLCSITNPDYRMISADFIAFILPGVFAVCQKLLLEKLTQMHSLENVKCASKLLTNVISTAFSEINSTEIRIIDQRKEENATPSNAILDFKRDENWMKMAKQKIVHQVIRIGDKYFHGKVNFSSDSRFPDCLPMRLIMSDLRQFKFLQFYMSKEFSVDLLLTNY